MIKHDVFETKNLIKLAKTKQIKFGGNSKLKIFGTLNCKSGKRMKRENRVFFFSQKEATKQGYRPCGRCMRNEYLKWKNETI